MPSSPPGSLTVFSVWAGRSRLPRTQGLRSRPHPGPGAFAQAAPQASQLRLSCSLIEGGILRPAAGLLHGLHPLAVQGRPKRAVRSAARHSLFNRPLRCRKEASGFRRLQPAAALPQAASAATARRTPPTTLSTCPSRLAGLAGLQRWPASVPTLHPDQTDLRTTATARHDLGRLALRAKSRSVKNNQGRSSGFAAATGVHRCLSPWIFVLLCILRDT